MSTFQKFRKSHELNKSNSKISKSSQPLNLVNIEFDTNQILFHYEQSADVLISKGLKITNYGIHGVYFRIVSTHSQYYEIIPSQDILYSSAKVKVSFKLKKNLLSINPRESYTNNFEKVEAVTKKDLFYVQWAMITEDELRSNTTPEPKYQQILTVKVVQPYTHDKSFNHRKRQSQSRFQQQKMLDDPSKSFNLSKEDPKDKFDFESVSNLQECGSSLLTTPIIAAVAIVSFLIGFFSA